MNYKWWWMEEVRLGQARQCNADSLHLKPATPGFVFHLKIKIISFWFYISLRVRNPVEPRQVAVVGGRL